MSNPKRKSEIITREYTITKLGVQYVVQLTVNLDHLAIDMVNNAARNKSRRASAMGKAIVATARVM